ncbi:MAG TPA: bifunctional demethylmenaquinone methyltransferase/2-methoxy-6-polyprenyl-1,4-benzoquinol methylase UbiE [Sphingomonadales bacterium]
MQHTESEQRGKSESDSDIASFGFRTVRAPEKAGLVRQVFNSVAERYDIMNDVMSGGLHRLWKTALVDHLAPRPGMRLIDVAGGTGDIAFRIFDRVKDRWPDGEIEITVCDINDRMLSVGRDRAIDSNRGLALESGKGISWVCGDAERLPVPDQSFDAYTIAFGIRNVTHRDRALEEAYRVLRPGGRFLCLEFSRVEAPLLDRIYDAYSFNVIPRMGQMIAGDADSYRYLVESIRRFPDARSFAGEIAAAGFERVSHRLMTGGVVALHSGWRI